jgi:hypothetical protein
MDERADRDPTTSNTAPGGRPTIAGWLVPLTVGTPIGAWAAAAFHALTDPRLRWLPYVSTIKWVVYLVGFTFLAIVQVALTAAFDVVLLRLKLRQLPTGLRAWSMAFGAPALGGALLKAWPTVSAEAWLLWLTTLILPMLGVGWLARVALGRRIER